MCPQTIPTMPTKKEPTNATIARTFVAGSGA